MTPRFARPRLCLLAALAVLAGACGEERSPEPARAAGEGVVVHPVDGDTLVVDLAGHEERVRLIGIDTPESVAQDRPVECFGPEAKDRLAALLPAGTAVRLERDVEARDRYDRLLAYVHRTSDDVLINLLLVQEGFAEARRFEPNVARQAELDTAEAEARAAQRGLWAACGGTDVTTGPVGSTP